MIKKLNYFCLFFIFLLFACTSKSSISKSEETATTFSESTNSSFAYTINKDWLARVKEIVDWAYEEDMYVIINIHHDNTGKDDFGSLLGYYPSEEHKLESIKYLTRIWEQISETFNNDYDEHLVFEVMNEPRLKGHIHEWGFSTFCKDCRDSMNVVKEFNQACLDTIRKSGGNNAKRLVVVPSLCASPFNALNPLFQLPKDSAKDALALSVHMYSPYDFAMGVPGGEVFTTEHKKSLENELKELNQEYVLKGIPVIIGEMGATNKDNLTERGKWFAYFVQNARKYGMATCVWDNGSSFPSKTESERYGYYNRTEKKWFFPLLMDIALKASGVDLQNLEADSYLDSNIDIEFQPQNKAQEIVYDMGFGWNLGNTLDATHWQELQNAGLSTETGWGQPKTTKEMIQGLKALGIKTIRIPISWHNHIDN